MKIYFILVRGVRVTGLQKYFFISTAWNIFCKHYVFNDAESITDFHFPPSAPSHTVFIYLFCKIIGIYNKKNRCSDEKKSLISLHCELNSRR